MAFDSFKKLGQSIKRTREGVLGKVAGLFDRAQLDDALYDELEELLIQGDVGVDTTEHILSELRGRVSKDHITDTHAAMEALKEVLVDILKSADGEEPLNYQQNRLNTVLVVGVNGTGKTTSIAKLAWMWRNQGYKPMIAAADTFRAAAIEQIKIWGERSGTHVVSHQHGADPGAVVFDAIQAGQARGADLLIIDTAGRLHTKFNLMEELKKIGRVLSKWDETAPHNVFLVVDATSGQNAVEQARQFSAAIKVDGVVLAKLDGTARGGCAFSIVRELGVPIKYAGTGEGIDDIADFSPEAFVDALLSN